MGGYICSAALINNTSQDLTPYVLTAYHCVQGENPNYFTFIFTIKPLVVVVILDIKDVQFQDLILKHQEI